MTTNYNVISSNGEITLDAEGNVTGVSLYTGGDERLASIIKFDFGEYINNYGSLPDHGGFDILDIGYWNLDGSYQEPCLDHRNEIKLD